MMKTKTETKECPNGRVMTYRNGSKSTPRHCYKDVSFTRLPKGDKRGDYHAVQKCKYCGDVREYDCITLDAFAL